jgi:hypothetical protein
VTCPSDPQPGVALPLVRKTVKASAVRVGDYWECADGTALRVHRVDRGYERGAIITIDMGGRVDGRSLRTWARPSERVQIRRLKPDDSRS